MAQCGQLARVHGVAALVVSTYPQRQTWNDRDGRGHPVLVQHGGCILKSSTDLCRCLALHHGFQQTFSTGHPTVRPKEDCGSMVRIGLEYVTLW